MRQQIDSEWHSARRPSRRFDVRRSPLRWLIGCGALILILAYLQVSDIEDPVIALAAPTAVVLPTKKPSPEPRSLERVHILNPAREQSAPAPSVTSRANDGGAASYIDLRRELLSSN
jgi:hypothetical protein